MAAWVAQVAIAVDAEVAAARAVGLVTGLVAVVSWVVRVETVASVVDAAATAAVAAAKVDQ